MLVKLTKELYDTVSKSIQGIKGEKPVAIQAQTLRALINEIDRSRLPSEDGELDVPQLGE